MTVLGYIAMIFVGLSLGLIGGGGSILTMPILVYLFAISPVLATSYSLFIVGSAALFGVWRYHLQGLVDYRTAITFVTPSFLGTYLARHVLLPWIPSEVFQLDGFVLSKDQLIMIVFAVIMLGASISMIRPRTNSAKKIHNSWKGLAQLILLGLMVGFAAGFVGAGGGFLIIPALVVFGGLAMNTAVATSLFIISANSMVAFGGDLLAGVSIDWTFLTATTGVAALGLFAGVKFSRAVSPAVLKVSFGWFVMVMGTWIIAKQLI